MEKIVNELTSKIESIISKAEQENRVLTNEEVYQLSILSSKLELLKTLSVKSQVAPLVRAEKKLDKVSFNHIPRSSAKDKEELNYISGLFWLSVLNKDQKAISELNSIGVQMALNEGTGSQGGYLVPREMAPQIIELFETYGVIRPNAFFYPLGSLNNDVPISSTVPAATFANEGAAFTNSDPTFSQVTLTPKRLGTMFVVSSELEQDQIVNLGDFLNRLAARSIAYKEDDTGFNGDGTAGYGSITGLKNALQTGSVYQGAAKRFATLTLDDFEQVMARVPAYALSNAKWYISNTGFALAMLRLSVAAGGNTTQTIGQGLGPSFLGYPVVVSQVLPKGLTDATNTILFYFGDMSQTLILGDRMRVTIDISDDRYFETYQRAIRVAERIDMKVFNPGTASESGAVAAFKTAAT